MAVYGACYFAVIKSRRFRCMWHGVCMAEIRNAFNFLDRKPEENRPLVILRHSWENVDWVYLAHSNGLFWTRKLTCGFRIRRGIFRPAKLLQASEGLCLMYLVNLWCSYLCLFIPITYIILFIIFIRDLYLQTPSCTDMSFRFWSFGIQWTPV